VALALLAACGADNAGDADGSGGDEASDGGGWTSDPVEPTDDTGIYRTDTEATEGDGAPVSAAPPVDEGVGSGIDQEPEPTAGSVDDNELWDEYLLYRSEFLALGLPVSDIPVDGRQLLTVVDRDGDPVLGATIEVSDPAGTLVSTLRTHADGRAVFLGSTDVDASDQSRAAYTATVVKGAASETVQLEPGTLTQTLSLPIDVAAPARLDIAFLIDATGSMGDEIERLKASMISVSEQIAALPPAPDVRFGSVVYRDRGDEYVTRRFDFTGDVNAFTAGLSEVVADGGGDTPEALGSGLSEAVERLSWRGDDTVKLVFLVADAAPHLRGEPGYEDEPDYAVTLREAATRGIKVFPIASSDLDAQGEFVFRQLAQVTMGRFVFLTYGADGASPGDSTPHQVDPEDYDVLALDDLVVQLVRDELSVQ
jgi:hypothetical protein